jgi:hypothetical protein
LRIITLALVLLSAVPASAQTVEIPLPFRELSAAMGATTDFDEFVEAGERPNDQSVDWFLAESGFGPRELVDGWHSFPVDYGQPYRAGVQVKLTDGGTTVIVRLVQTRTPPKSPSRKGLDPWLNPRTPEQAGGFRERAGLAGVTLATKGLTDLVLHRTIRRLMNAAEEGR